jgi:peroxiredoxin
MPSTGTRTGELIPHFTAVTIHGESIRYRDLWQQRNLVLYLLPHASAEARGYLDALRTRLAQLRPDDVTLVAIEGPVQQLPESSVVLCDRWGEIEHVASLGNDVQTWPPIDEIVEWTEFIRSKCPECPAGVSPSFRDTNS